MTAFAPGLISSLRVPVSITAGVQNALRILSENWLKSMERFTFQTVLPVALSKAMTYCTSRPSTWTINSSS